MTRVHAIIGDSITDAGRDRADGSSIGDGYVRLLASAVAPDRVVNLGISGDRATDILARWSRDVAPIPADVVTLYVGVNDMWRRFDSDDPTSAADFEASYRRILALCEGASRVILMEPFLLPVREEQEGWLEDLDEKRAVVRRLGAEFGHDVVPLHDLLSAAADEHGAAALAPDGVHPSELGARLIADAWLEVGAAREG